MKLKIAWVLLFLAAFGFTGGQQKGSPAYTGSSGDLTVMLVVSKTDKAIERITGAISGMQDPWQIQGTYSRKNNAIRGLAKNPKKPYDLTINGEFLPKSNSYLVHLVFGKNSVIDVECKYIGQMVVPEDSAESKVKPSSSAKAAAKAAVKAGVRPKPTSKPVAQKPKPKPAANSSNTTSANTWGLVEVISDPEHQTRSWDVNGYGKDDIELRVNHYRKDYVGYADPQHTKLIQDYHFNVRLEPPPAQIKEGQTFELTVLATCTGSIHGEFIARWGWYDGIDCKLVRAGKSSADGPYTGQKVYVGLDNEGFEPTASGVYQFSARGLSNEFSIVQHCDGKLAIFKYRKGAKPIPVPGGPEK